MLEEDEQVLREQGRTCRDARERVRYLALHALAKGHAVPLVADVFCVDDSTVYEWIEKWKRERSLQDHSKPGRPAEFTAEDKATVKRLLEEGNPKNQGVNASAWDTRELQRYHALQGRTVSRDTLRRCLKGLGAKYVKARLEYCEADKELQKKFALQFFLEHAWADALVFFEDEMSVCTSPRKGYGWTLEKRLVVKAPQSSKSRLTCFGAVNSLQGEVIQMTSRDSKSPAFVKFLKKLSDKHPGKDLVVYLDNLRVHHSRKVQQFLGKHSRIRLAFLPPYSPDLNPQEQWHGFQRLKLLNNRVFASEHSLTSSIHSFAKHTPPQTIQSVCSLEPLTRLL